MAKKIGRPVKQIDRKVFEKSIEGLMRGELTIGKAAEICGLGYQTFERRALAYLNGEPTDHYFLPEKLPYLGEL